MLALALAYGELRLAEATDGPAQRVALVVHNQAGWGVDVSTPAGRDLVATYTAEVAALPGGVQTAVLPEGAFTVDDASLPALVGPLSQVARSRGTDVVVGFTRLAEGERFATALTVPGDGSEPVPYLKHHDQVSPPGHDLALGDWFAWLCIALTLGGLIASYPTITGGQTRVECHRREW